jgi:pyruvate dehydrogenase E1 component alpha subunit
MTVETSPNFFPIDREKVVSEIGSKNLISLLHSMLRIRNFEIRAEAAYQQGSIGGFLHLYIGQEAIQTAAVNVFGQNNWYSTSYRCHALALLLGETPESLMAEMFGRANGNARGRGGSMHLYSSRMLGGFGIVAGQIPIATGAAFTCKYLGNRDEISLCFFGDGAVAQGVFHESLNLASLWSLPCLYVIENNKWSMGTPLHRTMANYAQFSQKAAEAFNIQHYLLDGADIVHCIAGLQAAKKYIYENQKPVLIECLTDRFRGHSISDPALYRTKEDMKMVLEKDPILLLKKDLQERNELSDEQMKSMEKACREEMIQAVTFAENSPWPDVAELEQDVLAPQKE